jgi:zinc finger protein
MSNRVLEFNGVDLNFDKFDYKKQVVTFTGNCYNCHQPCDTNMLTVDIPYFKEVVIMSTHCEHCGYKNSEVKAGGAIAAKGKRITFKLTNPDDINRSILKVDILFISLLTVITVRDCYT